LASKGRSYERELIQAEIVTCGQLVAGGPATGVFSPARVYAATFVVDRTDDDPSAFACTAAPNDCSLRGAINDAIFGGRTITLPWSAYTKREEDQQQPREQRGPCSRRLDNDDLGTVITYVSGIL
jgi:hypothetical protein